MPDPADGRPPVERCVVVVPAFDEEVTVGLAVRSVLEAAAALHGAGPPVDVVVVANGCTDRTAAAAARAGAAVVEMPAPNVGAARATGCAWALRRAPADRLWIATTDADGVVPRDWLAAQLATARRADAFVGTIVLGADDTARHAAWWQRYVTGSAGPRHAHVHGANLGFRGSAYLAAGGFDDLAAHEDVGLVARLVTSGAVVERSLAAAVTTSARHTSRVEAGVGPDLAASAPGRCMKPTSSGTSGHDRHTACPGDHRRTSA